MTDKPYMIYLEDGDDEVFLELPQHVPAESMIDAVLKFYTDRQDVRHLRLICVGPSVMGGGENIADLYRCVEGTTDNRSYGGGRFPIRVETLYDSEEDDD